MLRPPRHRKTISRQILVACCCLALSAIGAETSNCLFMKLLKADATFSKRGHYEHNIHHQSEYLFPTIGRMLHDYSEASPLQTLVADFPLRPWSKELLQLVAPKVTVIAHAGVGDKRRPEYKKAVQACGDLDLLPQVNKSSKCSVYFHHPDTLPRIREAVAAKCGIPIPRHCNVSDRSSLKIGILDRHTKRSLTNVDEAIHALRHAFPSEIMYRKTFDHATLCQQAEWFSGVDALVMAHGQAATTSIVMAKDTLLVEVLPWTLVNYCAYSAVLKDSGVRFQKVVVKRPTKSYKGFKQGKHTQLECMRSKGCYDWYRDRVNITIPTGSLIQAIQVAGGVHKVCA